MKNMVFVCICCHFSAGEPLKISAENNFSATLQVPRARLRLLTSCVLSAALYIGVRLLLIYWLLREQLTVSCRSGSEQLIASCMPIV